MNGPFPAFDSEGNLPPQVYRVTLGEVLAWFGSQTPQRQRLGERLRRLFRLAKSTGQLERFILFGSFVTSKEHPRDLDIYLLMSDDFQQDSTSGDAAILFDHPQAEVRFGVSVFWLRPQTCLNGVDIGDRRLAGHSRRYVSRNYRYYRRMNMIQSDHQLQVTQERIRRFQDQLAHLRRMEKNLENYRAAAAGFLAEIDRMQLDVRDYLSLPEATEEIALSTTA